MRLSQLLKERRKSETMRGDTCRGETACGHDLSRVRGQRSAYPKNQEKSWWLETSEQEEMEREETESAIQSISFGKEKGSWLPKAQRLRTGKS